MAVLVRGQLEEMELLGLAGVALLMALEVLVVLLLHIQLAQMFYIQFLLLYQVIHYQDPLDIQLLVVDMMEKFLFHILAQQEGCLLRLLEIQEGSVPEALVF